MVKNTNSITAYNYTNSALFIILLCTWIFPFLKLFKIIFLFPCPSEEEISPTNTNLKASRSRHNLNILYRYNYSKQQ